MTEKYTPGAMKAAQAMVDLYETTVFSPGSRARLAEIITRETGDKEMGEALKAAINLIKGTYRLSNSAMLGSKGGHEIVERAEAILRKAGLL